MYDRSFLLNRVSIEHRRRVDVALAACKDLQKLKNTVT